MGGGAGCNGQGCDGVEGRERGVGERAREVGEGDEAMGEAGDGVGEAGEGVGEGKAGYVACCIAVGECAGGMYTHTPIQLYIFIHSALLGARALFILLLLLYTQHFQGRELEWEEQRLNMALAVTVGRQFVQVAIKQNI